ncbi:MAG TPA: phage holin family protein [Opitutaceae bacterium]|nr:phage holin family protein [Opitutaceae bacterium]
METEPPARPGILGSLRTLADGLLGSVSDRLGLISIELREEKIRLIRTLFWMCAVVVSGVLALAFVSLTLVYLFWESARLAVLAGLALAYTGAFVALVVAFRRFLARQQGFLEGTLKELDEDRKWIRGKN